MRLPGAIWRTAVALGALTLAAGAFASGAFKVYPVRFELTPAQAVQTMTIENAGPEPTRVQLRVYDWRQQDGADRLTETRDILANPALFELAPGGSQIARLGLRTGTGAQEKAYRVLLEEVPGARPARSGEIRTLLRISIPIFVPAPGAHAALDWHAEIAETGQLRLRAMNSGTAHIQFHRLTLKNAAGGVIGAKDVSIYLLPGSGTAVTLDTRAPVRAGAPVRVEAVTDRGDRAADLRVEGATDGAGSP